MATYSVTLDDLDLALLPPRTFTNNDFLKKELFQFQVMKTEIAEEPAATVYYKCHICAIQVPAAFASEHAASVKHRANARIASVALARTRGLIAALPPPHAERPHGRFCANCSLIVDNDHDKTKEHRVAVLHDKLLRDLMAAYVGDDQDDTNMEDSEFKLDTVDLTISEERNEVTEMIDTKNHNEHKQFKIDVLKGILPKRSKRSRRNKRVNTQSKEVEHTNEIDNQIEIQNNDDNRVGENDESNTNGELIMTSIDTETQTSYNIRPSETKSDDSDLKLSRFEYLTIIEEKNEDTEISNTDEFDGFQDEVNNCKIPHSTDTKCSDSELEPTRLCEDLSLSEQTNEETKMADIIQLEEVEDDVNNSSKKCNSNTPFNEVEHIDIHNNDDNKVHDNDDTNTNLKVTIVETVTQKLCKIRHSPDTKCNNSELEATRGEDLTTSEKRNEETVIADTLELEEIEDDVNNSNGSRFFFNGYIQLNEVEQANEIDNQDDIQNKYENQVDKNDDSNTNCIVTCVETKNQSFKLRHSTDTKSNDSELEPTRGEDLTTTEERNEETEVASYHSAFDEIEDINNTSEIHGKCDDSTQLKKVHVDKIDKQADLELNVDTDGKIDDINTNTEVAVFATKKETISKIRYSNDACIKIRNNMERDERVVQVYEDFVPDGNTFVRCFGDHYHTFIVKVGKVECKNCNSAFNCGEPLSRAFSLRHLYDQAILEGQLFPAFVGTPATEDSSVRKLSETYSQCYACNNVIKNTNVANHILTKRHQNKVKESALAKYVNNDIQTAVTADTDAKLVDKTVNQNNKQAEITETKVNTNVNTENNFEINFEKWWNFMEEVLKKKTTEELLRSQLLDKAKTTEDTNTAGCSNVNNKVEEPKPGKSGLKLTLTYPYEATDNDSNVRCVVCDCLVPNTLENRKGHLGGSNHATNVGMNKPSYPYEATKQEGFVRCVICNYNVPNTVDKRKGHLYGTRHANNLQNKEGSYPYESTNQDSILRCVVCDCKVPNTPENRKGHLQGSNHASNLEAKKGSYPFEVTKQESVLRCVICNCKVPNTPENRKVHLRGSRHARNLEAKNHTK